MIFTVSDVQNAYAGSLRLIAGAGGLARPIEEISIIDYELVPELQNKYPRLNFGANQLVLSSFLYARDSPHLITEAVKHLVSQGASALIIKNVFHLPIPDQALRYANARNFPVFLAATDLFFDRLIHAVYQRVEEFSNVDYAQSVIDALLRDARNPAAVRAHAAALNPSFKPEHMSFYVLFDEPLTMDEFNEIENAYRSERLAACENLIACYDGGVLIIMSSDLERPLDREAVAQRIEAATLFSRIGANVIGKGYSGRHFDLGELAVSITEAMQAARFSAEARGTAVCYEDLGVFKALLPFLHEDALQRFAHDVLEPLREHDSEHGSQLEGTLSCFMACGRSVEETAHQLEQHANTVRYRLEQVRRITGLDFKRPDDVDQLSLACKIAYATKVLPA